MLVHKVDIAPADELAAVLLEVEFRLEVELEVEEGCLLGPIESLDLDSHRLQASFLFLPNLGLAIPPST